MLFRDMFWFLSNFYPCEIKLTISGKELTFKNVEAAFQAQKNFELSDKFCLLSGAEAKKLGKSIPLTTPDWKRYRLYAMAAALHTKFKTTYLLNMLKLIKVDIVEDNYWGDTFWGVCKEKGNNILGKMLMNIRDNDNNYDLLLLYINNELIKYI